MKTASNRDLRDRLLALGRAARHVVPIATVVLVAIEWNGIPSQPFRDSLAYQQGASYAQSDQSLYVPLPAPGPHSFVGWPYIYPPPLAALLSPFPPVSYQTFDRIWLLLNVVAFWAFAASLGRIQTGRWSLGATLTWGAGLFFVPGSLFAIHFANVEPVIWALVGTAFAAPATAGLLLTLAASIKITPAWPLLALATRRPRPVVLQAGIGSLLLLAVCVGVFGVDQLVSQSFTWWSRILPSVAQGQFWGGSLPQLRQGVGPLDILGNLSLSFAPIQLAVLSGWDYDGGVLPAPVRFYLTTVGVAAPILVLWLTRAKPPREQAALVLVAAAFAAPIVRTYVLPLILLPLALRMRSRSQQVPASGPASVR